MTLPQFHNLFLPVESSRVRVSGVDRVSRVMGKFVGAYLGARISHSPPTMGKWMGLALTPQAGVAIGMALLVVQRFPEFQSVILPVVLGSTVFFELLGPVATRWVLVRVGEVNRFKQTDNINN